MNTLIDITTLHRIGEILKSNKNEKVRATDVVALLHFMELILFSEYIYYVRIENDKTFPKTEETFNLLSKYGCIPKNKANHDILKPIYSNSTEYYNYSSHAAINCANIINTLNQESFFSSIPFYFDEASQPTGVTVNNFFNLIKSKVDEESKSKEALLEKVKNDVANGTIESMVLGNDVLHSQLKAFYQKPNPQLDLVFRTLFRLKINENIAKHRNCIYSPAPQRARFDQLIHNSILSDVNRSILEIRDELSIRKLFDGVLSEFLNNEKLPLPAIAIGILLKSNRKEPIELLQWINRYRTENNDITEVREYISQIELANISGDYKKQRDAKDKIDILMKEVKNKINEQFMNSIMRTSSKGLLNLIGVSFENEISDEELNNFTKLFRLRKHKENLPVNFLSMTTENLLSESELGAWITKSFNRNIYYKNNSLA